MMTRVLTGERVSRALINGEMHRMKFDGCKENSWAEKTSPSLGGTYRKSVDGHREC